MLVFSSNGNLILFVDLSIVTRFDSIKTCGLVNKLNRQKIVVFAKLKVRGTWTVFVTKLFWLQSINSRS